MSARKMSLLQTKRSTPEPAQLLRVSATLQGFVIRLYLDPLRGPGGRRPGTARQSLSARRIVKYGLTAGS